MTQTIANLGEIGITGAVLTPFDLPILRDGATWVLTGYTNPRLEVWDLRTRAAITPVGSVSINDAANGVMRWAPDPSSFPSGVYEARFIVENPSGDDEPSGKFRFSIGANASP